MKKMILLLLVTLCIILPACNVLDETELSNIVYNFETDMQYVYHRQSDNAPLTVSPDGYYYVGEGGIIIYVDKKSLKATPLCNKVNCKHDNKQLCDAYQVNTNLLSYFEDECYCTVIQYYKGYLYTVDFEFNTDKQAYLSYLKRLNLDGTNSKRMTDVLETQAFIDDWFIHRGYLYYTTDRAVYRIDMEHPREKREVVFKLKNFQKSNNNIKNMLAYDDYLYFEYMVDDYNSCVINLKDLTVNELFYNGEKEHVNSFFKGRTVFGVFDDKTISVDHYFSDFYLGNAEKFTNQKRGISFNTDNKYIYFDNANNIGENETQTVWVYDAEMNQVDTFTLPWCLFTGQDENCFLFRLLDENGEACLYAMDKSQIGSINGRTPELTKLCKLNWSGNDENDYMIVE